MAMKDSTSSAAGSTPFPSIGQMPIEAGVALQKELLATYEKAWLAWRSRVKEEVELWTELAPKLVAPQSLLEVIDAYGECVARQMQMTVEDGQQLLHDYQEITQRITKAVSNVRLSGST